MNNQFDVIVFGATSFVGQLLCQYLVDRFNDNDQERLNWAIAGRSQAKLAQLKQNLQQPELPVLLADAADETSLKALCQQTRVIVSTVGPYALYGESLVKTCAESGTDYCDLTGEVQWIRQMLDRYEETARNSGARIVHCSGFDSIPSDLGVYFTQKKAREVLGSFCSDISMRVKAARGGISGGTLASITNLTREAANNPALRRQLANPYLLCPDNESLKARQEVVKTPTYDSGFGAWLAPFIMAGINSRVVLRSNALAEFPYGRDFRYSEAMLMGAGFKGRLQSSALVGGLGLFMLSMVIKPTRWFMERFVLPKPGEGPSPEAQKTGFYDIRFLGKTADGQEIRTRVVGQGDPGYGSTARMLGQVAAGLALDFHDKQQKSGRAGGFWTTSTLFGDRLIERLEKDAEIKFEVVPS
ncbi:MULTISPECIES: saccharopine dehydrogenase family protein [unclassified Endozoicomonas]|uniref:saccharopine dehydrogenase family protein n=1 Tax=unclassified Endozoicomonas TaxID=2644528 RepID=UPI003BB57E89